VCVECLPDAPDGSRTFSRLRFNHHPSWMQLRHEGLAANRKGIGIDIMNEQDWLTWWDAFDLLSWCADGECRISQRKLRLFAVACCRTIWPLLTERTSRQAVEVAERYADHQATLESLRAVRSVAEEARRACEPSAWESSAPREEAIRYCNHCLAECLTRENFTYHPMAQDVADTVNTLAIRGAVSSELWGTEEGDAVAEKVGGERGAIECRLVREIFCNPLRPLSVAPAWQIPQVLAIARTAYEERRWQDLPLLADALEEAGCDENQILSHCRGCGPHVRGCWVVDLLLGKE
jgi:hypothetical protein